MKSHIWSKRTVVQPNTGLPRPTVTKHTITFTLGILFPKTYTRVVRRPYTGEELRQLRAERGVGQVRRIGGAVRKAA
jgi:hypothetical protein